MKRVIDGLVYLLLILTSIAGLANGIDDFRYAKGPGQLFSTSLVLSYGIAGSIALTGLYRKRKWTMIPLLAWAGCATGAASLATHFYGNSGIWPAVTAGGSVLLIAVPVILYCRWKLEADS